MTNDNFLTGKEARDKLVAGANKVADAVKGTLGAGGYNYISEHTLNPFYITSNDGVQLAKAIKLADPYEQLGAQIMQEIASRADKSAHDGTTTAITLAQAIIKESLPLLESDTPISPMELKRELEACIPVVEEALKAQAKEIDVSEVGKVATVSAEDAGIGATIQEIYEKIGPDGIIFNDTSQNYKDSYEIDKGVHIADCGFAHSYMADMSEQGQFYNSVDIKNPLIVVTKQKINSTDDINSIGYIAKNANKELVIFVEEIEGKALEQMVTTRFKSNFRTVVFKLPVLWKDWWIEDIARLTGATVIDPSIGTTLQKFTENMAGTCGRIIASGKTPNSPGDTFLDGTLDVSSFTDELNATGNDDDKIRAARLNKKTARYHVGALSEQALKYRHDKVVDALGSAYQALHGGVVAGGGVALYDVVLGLNPKNNGEKIMQQALLSPARQIAINAGIQETAAYGNGCGYNVKTGQLVNMFDAGIVDAYATVLSSFKSAISVAATILTAQVVTLLDKTPDKQLDPFRPYER